MNTQIRFFVGNQTLEFYLDLNSYCKNFPNFHISSFTEQPFQQLKGFTCENYFEIKGFIGDLAWKKILS